MKRDQAYWCRHCCMSISFVKIITLTTLLYWPALIITMGIKQYKAVANMAEESIRSTRKILLICCYIYILRIFRFKRKLFCQIGQSLSLCSLCEELWLVFGGLYVWFKLLPVMCRCAPGLGKGNLPTDLWIGVQICAWLWVRMSECDSSVKHF